MAWTVRRMTICPVLPNELNGERVFDLATVYSHCQDPALQSGECYVVSRFYLLLLFLLLVLVITCKPVPVCMYIADILPASDEAKMEKQDYSCRWD